MWSEPIRNHSTYFSYGPPPWTKCQATPSATRKPAPIAAIPYTGPPPGVRLPKNSVSAAEMNGRRAISHACSTNHPAPLAAAGTPSAPSSPTT